MVKIDETKFVVNNTIHNDFRVKPDPMDLLNVDALDSQLKQRNIEDIENIDPSDVSSFKKQKKSGDFGLGSAAFAQSTIAPAESQSKHYEVLERAKKPAAISTENSLWGDSKINKSDINTSKSESLNVMYKKTDKILQSSESGSLYENTAIVQTATAQTLYDSAKIAGDLSKAAVKEQKEQNEANVKAYNNKWEVAARAGTAGLYALSAVGGFAGLAGINSMVGGINSLTGGGIPTIPNADRYGQIMGGVSNIAKTGETGTPILTASSQAEISGTSGRQRSAETQANRIDQEKSSTSQKEEGQLRSAEQSEDKRSQTVLTFFR